jgi:hypothetical protein
MVGTSNDKMLNNILTGFVAIVLLSRPNPPAFSVPTTEKPEKVVFDYWLIFR